MARALRVGTPARPVPAGSAPATSWRPVQRSANRRAVPVRLLAAAAGGVAQLAAAPPLSAWPLGLVGAALLMAATWRARTRDGALAGLVCGLALFIPLLSWLSHVGLDAWLLLAATQALWLAALGAALALVSRLPAWPLWAACVWVACEWARERVPLGGFTWGRLAFGQTHSPLTPYAALGGAPLLTFVVALAAACAVAAVSAGAARRRIAAAAGLLAVTGLLAGGLAVAVPTAGQSSAAGPAYATVAAVQGNVPRLGLDSVAQGTAVFQDHLSQTALLVAQIARGTRPRPQLVVWPEDSVAADPTRTPTVAAALDRAARAVGAPLLVGAILHAPDHHLRNAGVVWTAGGAAGSYAKRHLVPFGEYIPLRSLLSGLSSRFALVPEDFVPGNRVGVLRAGPIRLGEVICFEVTFDGPVRDAVDAGGRLLVVQTNDATFESPGQPWDSGESAQQLAIARLRSVEHGRAVVVASTSGVSALIGPDGRLIAHTGVFAPALLEARLPLRDSRTVADRLGPLPEYLLTALGLAALAAAAASRRRRRR